MPFCFKAAAWLGAYTAFSAVFSIQAFAQSAPCNGGGYVATTDGVACGRNAQATDSNTTAIGTNSYAGHDTQPAGSGNNATAIGAGSYATGQSAVGIGNQYFPHSGAFGTNSIAIGTNSAAGDFTNGLQTTGNSAIAIGANSQASSDYALALGQGAHANFIDSTAIGNGATATGAHQMVFGTGANTYYMPGLPNTAATAGNQIVSVDPATGQLTTTKATTTATGIAVGGTFSVSGASTLNGGLSVSGGTFTDALTVTGDTNTNGITNTGDIQTDSLHATTVNAASGTFGTANVTTANIETANVSNAFSVSPGAAVSFGNNVLHDVGTPIVGTDAANKAYVDASVNSAFKKIDENTQGIAIAIALGGIALPQGKNFAVAANVGFYDDKEAVAAQGAVRLDSVFSLNGGIGLGVDDASKVGGRVGIMAAW
ncbi:MAG: YadA-like family protein [Proteobacteria bacterium]|nr:YadA-like family protein [Pseudomonadota bacterium]